MLTEFKLCANYPTAQRNVIHVQGHKVKHSNCSIALKFGTEFDHGKCEGHRVKGQGHGIT